MTSLDRSVHIDQVLFPQEFAIESEGCHEAPFKTDN